MDKETIFDRFDTGLKVRTAGNILTAVCILLRLFVFPQTISPLFMLIPMVIGIVMSLFISAVITSDDEQLSPEKYAEYFDEFEEKHRNTVKLLSTTSFVYVIASVVMIVLKA